MGLIFISRLTIEDFTNKNIMTAEKIIDKVIELRRAQRMYFGTKMYKYLQPAKDLEIEVDEMIEEYKQANDK